MAGMLLTLISVAALGAQELEPRAYRTLPTGLNFAVLGAQYTNGNVLSDPTSPLQDLQVEALVATVGYLRSFGLAGRAASLTVALPYIFMSGSATLNGELASDTRSGAAEPVTAARRQRSVL